MCIYIYIYIYVYMYFLLIYIYIYMIQVNLETILVLTHSSAPPSFVRRSAAASSFYATTRPVSTYQSSFYQSSQS